ncbi:MAG: hypothetical protein Kapaf2KO_11960 [Candidatus Kapaibacteriales bacterium]
MRILYSILLSLVGIALFAQGEITPKAEEVAKAKAQVIQAVKNNSTAMGRQFVVAFPPNYDPNYTKQALDIYISASEDTEVCISNANFNLKKCLPVEALGVTTFSTTNETSSWSWELWDDEQVKDFGFEISADRPISVYVMISKRYTSEGYMAIPVSSWGKKYIHNNYYHWIFAGSQSFSSGFVIISNSDDTRVTIDYKGRGDGAGQTKTKGMEIGDRDRITLDKHQVYMVLTDSDALNTFDLSGTEITANKDIGVISFHQIVWIPNSCGAGDNVVSMMPPIEAWGKEYATIELQRGTDKGDYMRVFAAENDTKVTISSFNPATNANINTWVTTLNKGEFWDYNSLDAGGHCGDNNITGIRGVTLVKGDKPVYVQQYAYSAQWDCVSVANFDPFTFPVTAREQYTNQTVFQTPYNNSADNEFNNNYFNIVAIGDTADGARHNRIMNSITIDGTKVTSNDPGFGIRRIPGTDYYYGRVQVERGPHLLKGDEDARFGAYIYGFADWDSYAWPAATNYDNLSEVDTLPPVLEIMEDEEECGVWRILATETRNGSTGNPIQVDRGFVDPPQLLVDDNFIEPILVDMNFRPTTLEDFPLPGVYEYYWEFRVDDFNQDARIEGFFVDQAKNPDPYEWPNSTDFTLEYFADDLIIDPDGHDFGLIKVGNTSPAQPFVATVNSPTLREIKSIRLLYNNTFRIVSGDNPLPNLSVKDDQHTIEIAYTPIENFTRTELGFDVDTLIIETACAEFRVPVRGQGVESAVRTTDFINNKIAPGETICTDEKVTGNITMFNNGTDVVIIFGISKVEDMINGNVLWEWDGQPGTYLTWAELDNLLPEFSIPNAGGLPIQLGAVQIPAQDQTTGEPGSVELANVCFSSNDLMEYAYDITFHSSTDEGDHISKWEGEVTNALIRANDLRWDEKRIGTHNKEDADNLNGIVTITNSGNESLIVTDIQITDNGGNPTAQFSIDTDRQGEFPAKNWFSGQVTLCPEDDAACGSQNLRTNMIQVPVKFTPTQVAPDWDDIQGQIVITYKQTLNGEDETLTHSLGGSTFLPNIAPEVEDFDRRIFPGFTSNKVAELRIANPDVSQNSNQLSIDEFIIDDTPAGQNAIVPTWDVVNTKFPFGIGVGTGERRILTYEFAPTQPGTYSLTLSAVNDALEGTATEDEPRQTTLIGTITASTIAEEASAIGYDFGVVSSCLQSVPGTIQFTNDEEAEIEYRGIRFIDPTLAQYFNIDDAQLIADANRIAQNQTITIDVDFLANVYNSTVPLQAEFVVLYDAYDEEDNVINAETDAPVTLSGSTESLGLEFSIDTDYANRPIEPGLEVYGNAGEGDNIDISVINTVEGANYWDNSDVRSITIDLIYDPTELYPIDNNALAQNPELLTKLIPSYSIINGWTIDEMTTTETDPVNQTSAGLTRLTITLSGPNKISRDGVIISAPFLTLLQDDMETEVILEAVTLGTTDNCSDYSYGNLVSPIELIYCESNIRTIVNVEGTTSFEAVSPNPITGSIFDVNYEISVSGKVSLEITDIDGKVVANPINRVHTSGSYSETLSTHNLPSGAFFLTLKTPLRTFTQQIVIAK